MENMHKKSSPALTTSFSYNPLCNGHKNRKTVLANFAKKTAASIVNIPVACQVQFPRVLLLMINRLVHYITVW